MIREGNIYISNISLKKDCGRLQTIINVRKRFELSIEEARTLVEELLIKGEIYVDDFSAERLKEYFDFESERMENNGEAYVINETKYAILYAGELKMAEDWYASLSDKHKNYVDFLTNHNCKIVSSTG